MRLRPSIARAKSSLAALACLAAAAGLAACATDGMYMGGGVGRHAERAAPANQVLEWSPNDRFYRAVTLERGSRDRAAMESALERANLRAPAPAAARYGLQVVHGRGRAPDAYRLIDRASGQPLFEQEAASASQFIVALGAAEHVTVATIVPCIDSAEVRAMKGALLARGQSWRTDDCLAYRQNRSDGGLRYSNYR